MGDTNYPKKPRKGGLGRNPTSKYQGGTAGWFGYTSAELDGAPWFRWLDVARMRRDPHVRFLERMWRAPFQKVKWKIKAESPAVAKFVDTTLRRFWRRSLPKLLSRYWRYGCAPGGAEYCVHRNHWRLDRVRTIEPQDAAPRVWAAGPRAGQAAGFTIGTGSALLPDTGSVWVGPPHAMWFAGYADLTPWHDEPPISGLFEPWLDKNGRGGARHSRRQYMRQAAWRGAILRHPPGQTNIGTDEDPQMRDNQDIARESLDYLESGSKLTMESTRNPTGEGYEWEYEDATANPDVPGIRDYPKDLDKEMSTGAGIPPEVLEASEVGSGWSGRLIPLLGYLGTVDELTGMLVESADPWMRPLARANFGQRCGYEVEPLSLVDEMQQQQGKGGGNAPQNPAQLFDGKPPPPEPPKSQPLTLSATYTPEPKPAHKYSSVYVELPPDAAARVTQLGRQIAATDLADKGREDEPHVTIRYGLETDAPDDVRPVFADAGPARLTLGAVGVFTSAESGKPYDVVMVTVDSPDLRRLNRELASLPHADLFPTYRPHATIACVKPGLGAGYAKKLGAVGTDVTVSAAVFSDRDRNHTPLPFGRGEAAAAPLELSWTPYEGPKGGTGWVSDTGEVRYQEAQPADDEGGEHGPESVFSHPDFAHIPEHTAPTEPRDPGRIRADAHAKAEAEGIDPAELHRRAAARLHRAAADVASDPRTWTAARHLQNHDAQEKSLRLGAEASANRARAARAEGNERAAAGHEQAAREALAKADGHRAEADAIRGGAVPPVASANKRALLAGAYADAHKELAGEKENREEAARFADAYFDEEKPARRAAGYIGAVAGGALDADLLPEDTRAAVAEDLSHLPPAKLAAHVFAAVGGYAPDSAEHQIAATALDAAAGARPAQPLPFDGADPDKYVLVTPDNTGEDEFNGLHAAARLLPGVKAPLTGALLVKASSPLGKLAAEHGAGESLDGSEQHLFTALKTGYQLPLEHVPASARDYGGTSGSKGSGAYQPEEGWDANAVPVYKRVNEDWYVRLNPGTGEDQDAGYELVHKDQAPPLARLPDVYWQHLDADAPGADDEAVERAQKRDAKRSEEGAVQKRDIEEHRAAIKGHLSEVGKLKTAWQQALKGVPEDERPDEPEWDAVDGIGLTDSFESREEHAGHLDGLRSELHDHVDGLKEQVEDARAHAENHRANSAASARAQQEWEAALADVPEEDRPDEPEWRDDLGGDPEAHAAFLNGHLDKARKAAEQHGAAHREAAEKHRAQWRTLDAGVQKWLNQGKRAQATADADDALNEGLNDALFSGASSLENVLSTDRDDYPDDAAHAAVETVQGALDDLVNGSTPEHESGPDPDDYPDEDFLFSGLDEDHESAAERAEAYEAEVGEHKDRLKELAAAAPAYRDAVAKRSAEWRGEMRGHLARVRDAAAHALKALPEGDYPAAGHRADLTDLLARVGKLLPQFEEDKGGGKELSFTLEPGATDGTPPPSIQEVAQKTGGRLMRMRKAKLAQLVTLAMVRAQQRASERGNPRSAARDLAQLADMANDPDRVAQLVGLPALSQSPPGRAGLSLSWQPYIGKRGDRAGQQAGWFNPDSKEVRYQTSKPGEGAERARGRTASGSAGLAIAHKVLDGSATAEDLGELVDHLRVMTVPRLKNVAAMLDKKLGGLKRRDKMVEALLGHVGGLTAADGTKANGTKAAAEGPKPDAAPVPGEVRTVPTGDLKVDPQRFQFKLGTSNPAGVTKELQEVKAFNPEFAGVVAVWRDPADGKDYVVNGHHRHELAERTGHPTLAVRYLQAKDAREARAKGALINIAEGRGTAVDAAKFMRDMGVSPEDLAKHGVSLKGKLAADAATLTRLNDAAFDRVARGSLDPERALAVARHLSSPDRQEKLFKLLAKREDEGKDLSDRTVEELARQMQAAPGVTTTTSTLWGDETSDEDTFVERGELAAHVRAALSQEHNDFGAVASDRRAGKVAGAGNSLNVEENKRRAAEAEALKNVYETTAHRKGAVADALDAGAVKLKQAKTKKERDRARTETLDAVRTALRGRLDDPAGTGNGAGEGGLDPGRTQGSGTEPAAVAPAEGAADAGRAGEPAAGVTARGDLPGHSTFRNKLADPASVAAKPSTKKARESLARQVKDAWTEARNALAAKHGTRNINDRLTPEQAKAEADLLESLGVLSSGSERDGPRDLGPVNDARYQGFYRRAVQLVDQLRAGATADAPVPKAAAEPTVAPAPRTPRGRSGPDDARPTAAELEAASQPARPVPVPVVAPAPKPTDRSNLDSIRESTDRALGIKKELPPEPPKKGEYGALLRGAAADPARFEELQKLAPLPTLDRNELLAAVAEVYGPAIHAEAKKKSKQGIVELLKGRPPA